MSPFMRNALGIAAILGPLAVGVAGFSIFPPADVDLLYVLLVVPGLPVLFLAAGILRRRPHLLVSADTLAMPGSRYVVLGFNLLFAVLAGGGAGVSLWGAAYLVNGLVGEQRLLRPPCTVTEVHVSRSSSTGGTIFCRLDDGSRLDLDLRPRAYAERAKAEFPPGTRLEAILWEGSLGLRYTAGPPVGRVLSPARGPRQ